MCFSPWQVLSLKIGILRFQKLKIQGTKLAKNASAGFDFSVKKSKLAFELLTIFRVFPFLLTQVQLKMTNPTNRRQQMGPESKAYLEPKMVRKRQFYDVVI